MPFGDRDIGGAIRAGFSAVEVPPGGAVHCFAVAETPPERPIYVLLARILSGKNKVVDHWGYSFSAAPGVRSVGYFAEESVGSISPKSRYCQVVVDPADATLIVYFSVHVDGEVVSEAYVEDLGPCHHNNGNH